MPSHQDARIIALPSGNGKKKPGGARSAVTKRDYLRQFAA